MSEPLETTSAKPGGRATDNPLMGPGPLPAFGAVRPEHVEPAVREVLAQQRAALALSYYEEMSNGEIAEIMDTSVSAVESLLKRGRQKLRDLLRRAETDIRTALVQR